MKWLVIIFFSLLAPVREQSRRGFFIIGVFTFYPSYRKKQTVPIYLDNLIKPDIIRIYKQDFLKVDLFTGALFIHDSNNF